MNHHPNPYMTIEELNHTMKINDKLDNVICIIVSCLFGVFYAWILLQWLASDYNPALGI